MNNVRLAVVGCGAVADLVHLPSLASVRDARVAMVIDTDMARARATADRFAVPRATTDYRDAIGAADAAIVAVPHHLHAPIAIDLLRGGLHVLVEKPMALNTRECDAMIDAATGAQRLLAVNLLRRFHESLQFAKNTIDAGCLGTITSVEVREGSIYRWQVTTDAMFRRPAGGVLADIGVHVLDLLGWWFGDCEIVRYRDDAMGGVEADCEIAVRLETGIDARVELSRTRDLPCTAVIRGTRGTLEVGTKTDSMVRLFPGGEQVSLSAKPTSPHTEPPQTLVDLCTRALRDFVDAIRNDREPLVTGRDGRKSVALVEACYAAREPLHYEWEAPLVVSDPVAVRV